MKKKEAWLNNSILDIDHLKEEQIILYFVLCESLNFCFWDSNIKWKIEYKNEWYSGSFGLFLAFAKAIQKDSSLLDLSRLEKLTLEELDNILLGTTTIPMLEERFQILKGLISEIKESNHFEKNLSSKTDLELLNNIINTFHNFKDSSITKEKKFISLKVPFFLLET